MCRMDQSVSWVCKACSAQPGGHTGHPATSQSTVVISELATPAHASNPTPHLCLAPSVSRGNSPTTQQTCWPVCFFISVGTTASSRLLQPPSYLRPLVVLLLSWPTQLQPNPVSSQPKAPPYTERQKAGEEMFPQARRMGLWLKNVLRETRGTCCPRPCLI